MANLDASFAIEHPKVEGKILLLRVSNGPLDPIGSFAVLRSITRAGYSKHYSQQCRLLKGKVKKIIRNKQKQIDAVMLDPETLSEKELQSIEAKVNPEHFSVRALDAQKKAEKQKLLPNRAPAPPNEPDPEAERIRQIHTNRQRDRVRKLVELESPKPKSATSRFLAGFR